MEKYKPYKPKDGKISFKKATENMNTKEKLGYIWEYYKAVIIAVPVGIIMLISIINSFVGRQETYLNVALVSGFAYMTQQLPFENDELLMGADVPDHDFGFVLDSPGLTTTLSSLLLHDLAMENYEIHLQYLMLNADTISIFVTLAGAGELDVVISYQFDFDALNALGHFQNIRDLNVDIPNDKFINDYGISLNYITFFDDYIQPTNPDIPIILAIPAGSHRISAVEHLLYSLFE